MAKGGYALDMKADGFGLVQLGFHTTAMFADPLTDKLFLVLDEVTEPTSTFLPLPSTAPDPDALTVYEFNPLANEGRVVYRWHGKLYLLPRPAAFVYCQVKAATYDNLVLKLYADGVAIFERAIVSKEPFTLPITDDYDMFEIEVIGTSRVRSVEVSEDVEELA